MADGTGIEWCDATWNPVTGCAVTSPGCTNCYAMRLAGGRLRGHASRAGLTRATKAGPVWTGEVRFNQAWLDQPLRWRRKRRIFVCAHGDLFAEGVPDAWIDRVFAVMALAPQHVFIVLTKRAARMREYLAAENRAFDDDRVRDPPRSTRQMIAQEMLPLIDRGTVGEALDACNGVGRGSSWPLPNVWLGVSVEDQQRADERIPELLATPAAKHLISAEPLLGPIDLTPKADRVYQMLSEWYGPEGFDPTGSQPRLERMKGWFPRLDWVIAGGESGPGARPMHPDWARALRDQCAAADVPFFFKQWGAWVGDPEFGERGHDVSMVRVGKSAAGHLLDGREYREVPA
jgi:protein gp37